jgi:cytochrome P450
MTATASRASDRRAAADGRIPGPSGHPPLGMARALRGDPLGTLQDGCARYGDVVAYRVGPARGPRRLRRLVVALHHPDHVRRVFGDPEAFTRLTPSYRVLREMFGPNLVVADGDDWRRQKRLLQPLFTRAAADRLAAVVEQEARAAVEHAATTSGSVIDALRTTERYALRVIGRTLFAHDRGIDEDTVAALDRLVPVLSRQLHGRAMQLLRLPLRWPTPGNRRFVETREALRATIERVVARHREASTAGEGIVGKLRDARDPEREPSLSEQEIRDQALMFLLAGYATTALALCSTLHLLGRHPQIQDRVAAGGEQSALAAVREGLRLHPPSYVLGRRVGADGAEVAGHLLAPGTDVLVSPWITHRHPDVWSDPELFDPWRFVGEHERPPYAWFPFGGGPRACIGRHFALLESAIFVRVLLERHRLESLDATLTMDQLVSMQPSEPVRIACHRR